MANGRKRETVAERLVRLRRDRGMTQEDLARELGVTQPNVCDYERGRYVPNATMIVRLAEILGASADELLGLKPMKAKKGADPVDTRLWKKFQQVRDLPERDQRAIIRVVNTMLAASGRGNGERRTRRSG